MGINNASNLMSKEELRERIIEAATPIDSDRLIADGVLEKKGSWYKVLKADHLPKKVLKKQLQ